MPCGCEKVQIKANVNEPTQEVHLGCILPKSLVSVGRFMVYETQDGRVKLIPKMSAHYNAGNDAVPPPTSANWAAKAMAAISRMYLNDRQGDCVIASSYHAEGVWSGNDAPAIVLGTDQEVNAAYHGICGPGDNGCDPTDVMDTWKRVGLLFNGVRKKIDGYAAVDHTNQLLVQTVIEVFGGARVVLQLPKAWQCSNCVWGVQGGSGAQIVGGHDVRAVGYLTVPDPAQFNGQTGVICSTWGGLVIITWPAFLSQNWIQGVYAELGPDWYGADNLAPNGISAAGLLADLRIVQGGGTPPIPGPDPIPPIPIPPTPVPPGSLKQAIDAYLDKLISAASGLEKLALEFVKEVVDTIFPASQYVAYGATPQDGSPYYTASALQTIIDGLLDQAIASASGIFEKMGLRMLKRIVDQYFASQPAGR